MKIKAAAMTAIAAFGLLFPAPSASHAESATVSQPSAPTVSFKFITEDGKVIKETSDSGKRDINCVVRVDNPHWSKNGGTVLFKTRVVCGSDNHPTYRVRVRGNLGSISGRPDGPPPQGPTVTRATSDQTQTLVNGEMKTYYKTYYTPNGGPKVSGGAWFQGYITAQIVSPCCSNLGSASSRRVYVK